MLEEYATREREAKFESVENKKRNNAVGEIAITAH